MRQISDSPFAAVSGIGQSLAYCFGVCLGLPAVPLRTGAQGALAKAVSATDTTFVLDDVEALKRFPDAGRGEIQGERFTWIGRDFTLIALTGVTRHTESTYAAAYDASTALFEVIPEHVFAFFENPGAFRHRAIPNIYINGILKKETDPPRHTVTVEDRDALSDPVTGAFLSVGTVRFDMDSPIPADSPFASPTSAAQIQHYIQVQQAAIERYENSVGWHGFEIVGVRKWIDRAVWDGHTFGTGWFQLPEGPATWPQLGVVTADVNGLVDDATGSITGQAGKDITNPAHVVALLLREAYAQPAASIDPVTFAQAALDESAYGYHWDMPFQPMRFGQFQQMIFQQSRLNLFQDAGLWKLVLRKPGTFAMTLARARRVSWSMRWTALQEVLSSLQVAYASGLKERSLTLSSADATKLVPDQSGSLSLPWVTDAGMARDLGAWQLGLTDHQRRLASAVHHSEALLLARTDSVGVEAPMLDAYGGVGLRWKVRAARVRPDSFIEVDLEEEDTVESTPVEVMLAALRQRDRVRRLKTLTRLERALLGYDDPAKNRRLAASLLGLAVVPPPTFNPQAAILAVLRAQAQQHDAWRRDTETIFALGARRRRLHPALIPSAAPAGPPTGDLLLEDGTALLLEDGTAVQIEDAASAAMFELLLVGGIT